jgi:hypothetical protein
MYGFLPPIFAPSFGTRKLAGLKAAATNAKRIQKTCHPEGWRYKKLTFKGAGRQRYKSNSKAAGTKKLNVVQALAFQSRLQCTIHQHLG